MDTEERFNTLNAFGLLAINELANLIGLCQSCHTKFDNFRLGIHPTEKRWIVSEKERKKRPEFHKLVHSKKVGFHLNGIPSEKTLAWKWERFTQKNKTYFCCYCDCKFPLEHSTEGEFQFHLLDCRFKNVNFDETGNLEAVGGGK